MERRTSGQDRRKENGSELPGERRSKSRRKARNFAGSALAEQTRIDVSQEDQLLYWSEELGVSTDALTAAVQKVGPTLKALREHLGKT